MHLVLSVLRCPENAVPETRRIAGGDCTLGRGADCDWVLADPERVLSKRHCVLEFRGGGWQVRDLSTNGTFVNHASAPVGRDAAVPLNDGDRLRLGAYEIELRVEAGAEAEAGWDSALSDGPGYGAPVVPGFGGADRFGDPLRPVAPPSPGADNPFGAPGAAPAGGAPLLPADFNPLADEPPMPDHQPATGDAFLPPRPTQTPSLLPDDWDLDLAQPPRPAPPPPPPAGAGRASGLRVESNALERRVESGALDPFADEPPAPPRTAPPQATPSAVPPGIEGGALDPFGEEPASPSAGQAAAPAPPPGLEPPRPWDLARPPPPRDAFAAAEPAVPAPPPSAPPRPKAPPDAALAAFLAGAGLAPGAVPASDPEAALRALGAAFRAAVGGLRGLLIARADVKREFRIEQTMLRAAGNNPVKFAATDEAALLALAGGAARAAPAIEETVADLTAHQVATLAATQAAARALLDRLAPAGLEAQEQSGGGLFGAGREKRLWEAYRKLHRQVAEQFEDDFDSAFGKAFARAYEQAVKRDAGGAG